MNSVRTLSKQSFSLCRKYYYVLTIMPHLGRDTTNMKIERVEDNLETIFELRR